MQWGFRSDTQQGSTPFFSSKEKTKWKNEKETEKMESGVNERLSTNAIDEQMGASTNPTAGMKSATNGINEMCLKMFQKEQLIFGSNDFLESG